MTRILYLLIFVQTALLHRADAQQYDMVIKGGHVIDPGNHINRLMDVAKLHWWLQIFLLKMPCRL